MLRNIPSNYTRARFLSLLDAQGFAGLYDFAYLPTDFQTGSALGYAFVNLVEPRIVNHFWRTFDGFKRWGMASKKRCNVSWSVPYQGFEANMEHYRNSPVMHCAVPDAFKPIVFRTGARIPYPAPTKSIRVPRLRK